MLILCLRCGWSKVPLEDGEEGRVGKEGEGRKRRGGSGGEEGRVKGRRGGNGGEVWIKGRGGGGGDERISKHKSRGSQHHIVAYPGLMAPFLKSRRYRPKV